MARVACVLLGVLVVSLAAGQEASDSWLDGEGLMLNVLGPAALDEAVLEQFHPDCRIVVDSVMARHVTTSPDGLASGAPLCRGLQHWKGVRRYVDEFRARNDTTARFMRPSGIGAPWMIRYAVRCREACRGGMAGFEIRFTYDGRRVTRVEFQAR
jgi:hypothetical protein